MLLRRFLRRELHVGRSIDRLHSPLPVDDNSAVFRSIACFLASFLSPDQTCAEVTYEDTSMRIRADDSDVWLPGLAEYNQWNKYEAGWGSVELMVCLMLEGRELEHGEERRNGLSGNGDTG